MTDNINKPKHYTQGSIEPLDFIKANNMSFIEGNIVKYVTRYKHKNGLEDLKKAQFYLNKLIEKVEELDIELDKVFTPATLKLDRIFTSGKLGLDKMSPPVKFKTDYFSTNPAQQSFDCS